MARTHPGTQRIISILNLLAGNPSRAFSLTDLINGLKMNRATCHTLVNELVNAGYLYRTRDKLYVLGPAIVQLGKAAEHHATPLAIALPEMNALANRYDLICSALVRDRRDVVVLQRAVSVSHLDWSANRSSRWVLRPPFGGIFLAWSSDKDVAGWFSSLDPAPSAAERERTREGMAFARENGFQCVVRNMPEQASEETMEWLFLADPAQRPFEIGTSLEASEYYQLGGMSSPVFDNMGQVAFVLSFTGFSKLYCGREIREMGIDLRSTCERISNFSIF